MFFDRVGDKPAGRPDIQQAAAANSPENFKIVFGKEFEKVVVEQLGVAEDMAIKFLDTDGLRKQVLAAYLPLIYGRAKVCRIREIRPCLSPRQAA